ncbi:hypothetical protein HAX54_024963 [Datura stramonium]|uniref:J domain-containing protein n=1 Tax=Datura stramonium TaxID=4076 RepID=A0ABS8Y7V6_DATST|nr:hypothetical protein [Datura stramonium]
MDTEIDHYAVLDLPSGEEGVKLTEKDISKAYRKKALELHPDKRLDDSINAHLNFQKLKISYEILKNEKKRKLFHEKIMIQRQLQQQKQQKMMSDARAAVPDINLARLEEEERIARKLIEEIAQIRAMLHSKKVPTENVDKGRVLKVSWEKMGEDFSCERLRDLFSKFGEVEHVILSSRCCKKKRYAIVEMSSKDAANKAASSCGDNHPLSIVPLQPPTPPSSQDSNC